MYVYTNTRRLPQVDPMTGLIDYDRLEENAVLFRPTMIIAGGGGGALTNYCVNNTMPLCVRTYMNDIIIIIFVLYFMCTFVCL